MAGAPAADESDDDTDTRLAPDPMTAVLPALSAPWGNRVDCSG